MSNSIPKQFCQCSKCHELNEAGDPAVMYYWFNKCQNTEEELKTAKAKLVDARRRNVDLEELISYKNQYRDFVSSGIGFPKSKEYVEAEILKLELKIFGGE